LHSGGAPNIKGLRVRLIRRSAVISIPIRENFSKFFQYWVHHEGRVSDNVFGFLATIAAPVRSAVIGPDSHGNYITNAVSSTFQDISSTGTLVLTGDDRSTGVTFGFGFNFSGVLYNGAFVSTNGLITFNYADSAYSNQPMSYFDSNQPAIAVFWDDLITQVSGAGLYTQTIGSPGNKEFIVQWNKMDRYSSSPSTATFQSVFRENTQDILLRYQDTLFDNFADNGSAATIGIADGFGSNLEWAYNSPSVYSGDTLRLGPVPEPSTMVIGSIFGLGSLIARRRMKKQHA